MFFARPAAALAAILAIALSVWHLAGVSAGLSITRTFAGPTPVTIFAPATGDGGPMIVIAHGFAGSQQLMQPFAITLARNGYRAVTFDFLGHGRNGAPMRGDITREDGVTPLLVAELGQVVDFVRANTTSRVAILGHSMASDIVVRYAMAHPEVAATIAVSMFAPGITATSPRNLLVITGALEPQFLKDEALRATGMQADGAARPGVTYGDFAAGTARRASFSDGVEHIGVLYSRASLDEALAWLNAVFGRTSTGFADARGGWLGLLFGALVVLAWPLARLLPRVSVPAMGASLTWRRFWPLAVVPAILTPVLLWKLPTDFLPLLLGDYLSVHFAIYGLLTAAGLWHAGALRWPELPGRAVAALAAAALLVAGYSIFGLGLAIDSFVTSFMPIPQRLVLIPVVLLGICPYFLADEWLTRGHRAPPGAYAFTKLCFLLSLALAVALNLERLFFLIIIIPVMLIFLTVYGLFSRWATSRTGQPLAAGFGNALALAWAIAVTFPLFTH